MSSELRSETESYALSGIRIAPHGTPSLIAAIRSIIERFFPDDVAYYTAMPIDRYRDLVLAAQEHLNQAGYVRQICQHLTSDIVAVLGEDAFLIQSNLYLRATRPSVPMETETLGWHRETFYGPNMERSVNIWTPVAGVTTTNTLHFIPLSQHIPDSDIVLRRDEDPVTTKGSAGNKIGFLYAPKQIIGGVDLSKSTPMEVPEYCSAIIPGNLIHGATVNRSDRTRYSIDFRILPASAYETDASKTYHVASGKPYFEPF